MRVYAAGGRARCPGAGDATHCAIVNVKADAAPVAELAQADHVSSVSDGIRKRERGAGQVEH